MGDVLAKHKNELDRIANTEDYLDEADAAEDGAILLGIALDFEKEIERLTAENEKLRDALYRGSIADESLGSRSAAEICKAALTGESDEN